MANIVGWMELYQAGLFSKRFSLVLTGVGYGSGLVLIVIVYEARIVAASLETE